MKQLKLVINNDSKNKEVFFNKKELQTILNLYADMVSSGEWKDYGLSILKREVSFNVYHKASDSGELMGKKAVMGALTLYLDFINLFIMLLRLFGQRR